MTYICQIHFCTLKEDLLTIEYNECSLRPTMRAVRRPYGQEYRKGGQDVGGVSAMGVIDLASSGSVCVSVCLLLHRAG